MGALSRIVGADAIDVTVAGTLLTGAQHAGVTIRRGRSTVDEQPTAATCVLNVYEDALPALPMPGDEVRVDLGADAIAWLGVAADHVAVPRFVGQVTDARIVPASVLAVDRDVVQIVAASPLAVLGRTFIGDVPWPQELDGQRALRIIRGTGVQGSDFVTWVDPDLTVGSEEGDGFLYGRTGSHTLDRPTAPAPAPTDDDFIAGTPRTYFLGHTVDVTPGLIYRIRSRLNVYVAGTIDAVNLIVGPEATFLGDQPAYTGDVFGSNPDTGQYLEGAPVYQSDFYTVPAGVTSLDVGIEVVAADVDAALEASFGRAAVTPYVRINELTVIPYTDGEWLEVDGGTVEVVRRDVDRQQALGLLTSLAFDARGLIIDRRDGRLEYADADDRRGAAPAITLDAAEVIVGTEWAVSLEGVVNEATLTYGTVPEGGEQPTVTVRDDASIAARGRYAISRSTPLALEADAIRAAARIVGLGATPGYRMSRLLVDVLRTLPTTGQRVAALSLEQSSLVEVTGFPTSGPLTTGRLWLEGYTEEISAKAWRLDMAVSSYLAGGPGISYDDVPDTTTYDDVPDTLTHAQAWGYDPTAT